MTWIKCEKHKLSAEDGSRIPCPDCLVERARAEVLASAITLFAQREPHHRAWAEPVRLLRNLQPAASDLEAYVKNLPLSEIARIKGIPGIAKLGKTYDRPDFTCWEDE